MASSTDSLINDIKSLTLPVPKQEENKLFHFQNSVPEDKHPELAELLVDFAQRNGVLLPFIAHAVSLEVEQTKQESVLFREDCFAVKAINRVLFSDLGKKYLQRLVAPVCKTIVELQDSLDISIETLNSNKEKFTKSLNTSIELLNNFFGTFAKSPQFCPFLFREIFSSIQANVDEKFGKNNTAPYVLDFIFFKFVCPSIINPFKYGLLMDEADKMTPFILRAFVNFSKLVNNVSHGIYDKYEEPAYEPLRNVVCETHPKLLANLHILVDAREIQKMRDIVESNSNDIERESTSEEKQVAEFKLRSFLFPLLRRQSHLSRDPSLEGADLVDSKTNELLRKMNTLEWKTKTYKNYTYFVNSKECWKTCLTISCPLMKVFEFLREPRNQKLLASDTFLGVDVHNSQPHFVEYSLKLSFPFPASSRVFHISACDCFISENKAVIVTFPIANPKKLPSYKGFVSGRVEVGGYLLEADEPEVTRVTWLIHGDPGGSLPSFIASNAIGLHLSQSESLKTILENK